MTVIDGIMRSGSVRLSLAVLAGLGFSTAVGARLGDYATAGIGLERSTRSSTPPASTFDGASLFRPMQYRTPDYNPDAHISYRAGAD